MLTTNKNAELAVAVCPDCEGYSVCDPEWLSLTGETVDFMCEQCLHVYPHPHRILKFIEAPRQTQAIKDQQVDVFMCPECGTVYTVKVTQCDCHFGEQKWIEGTAVFPKENK